MIFRIYVIFYILLYGFLAFNPEIIAQYGVWEWIDTGVMIIALGGMASYAFRLKLLSRKFWEYYVYLFVIFELTYMTWLQYPYLEKIDLKQYISVNNLINVVLMIPIVWALFMLQRRWNELFDGTENKSPEE